MPSDCMWQRMYQTCLEVAAMEDPDNQNNDQSQHPCPSTMCPTPTSIPGQPCKDCQEREQREQNQLRQTYERFPKLSPRGG